MADSFKIKFDVLVISVPKSLLSALDCKMRCLSHVDRMLPFNEQPIAW